MLGVLLLAALAPAGLGFPAAVQPQLRGSQCVEHDCFALFRGAATFLAATEACGRLQGHLMTVRSSVAADVISLLLSGDGDGGGPHLWIGLQFLPGCRDPGHLGLLRGFQWVTGDNHTSYSRWARPDRDGTPLCGPLCVAVSAAGAPAPSEPVWEERPCAAQADGFLCEFPFAASCRPLAVEPRAAATASAVSTYNTPFGARGADFQTLPVGSSAFVAPLGLELVCAAPPGAAEARWGREEPGAWDCSVENGGCEHACNGSAGAPGCVCPADAALLADGRSCAAPGEHSCDKRCEHFCIRSPDVPGNYSCMCETGYKLADDLHGCEDVDDCLLTPNLCPQRCVNTQGGFECQCFSDYELVDGECVEPVDPCFLANCEYQCQPLGRTDYRCVCAEGFAPSPQDPQRCQMFCNQSSCPADCDPNTPDSCQCPDGYILDEGSMCTDIDECDNGYCADLCRNLPGSYECLCGPASALEGQASTYCDPTKASSGDEDDGSGEPPASPAPGATSSPPTARPLHSVVLIGISIASLSLVVALLALLCHLRKKQGSGRAELEYKCAAPAKELVVPNVQLERYPRNSEGSGMAFPIPAAPQFPPSPPPQPDSLATQKRLSLASALEETPPPPASYADSRALPGRTVERGPRTSSLLRDDSGQRSKFDI